MERKHIKPEIIKRMNRWKNVDYNYYTGGLNGLEPLYANGLIDLHKYNECADFFKLKIKSVCDDLKTISDFAIWQQSDDDCVDPFFRYSITDDQYNRMMELLEDYNKALNNGYMDVEE